MKCWRKSVYVPGSEVSIGTYVQINETLCSTVWCNHVWRAEHSGRIIHVHLFLYCDVHELRFSSLQHDFTLLFLCYYSRGSETSFTPELTLCVCVGSPLTENTPGHTFDFCMFYISGTCFITYSTWHQTPAVRSVYRWSSGPLLLDQNLAFQKVFVFLILTGLGWNLSWNPSTCFYLKSCWRIFYSNHIKNNKSRICSFHFVATGLWFCSVSL